MLPLMEPSVEQDPSDVVTCQPQATTGILTLGAVIKALLSEKESHGCYCLLYPEELRVPAGGICFVDWY